MSSVDDFTNRVENQWCPGCPNFGILRAVKQALAALGKKPHEVCLVSGIGQAAKLPHYLNCNFFNGLHGRALPAATGIHAANPALTTIVTTGDGDCYGEGGNHFLHAIARNPDITVLVHNNELYALTKGQASPTTLPGEKRTLQLKGVEKPAMNMAALAIANACTFVARGFAGDVDHLEELIVEAVNHRGLSFIDIVQPCITWGTHPVSWYRDRVSKTDGEYDPGDRAAAFSKVIEPSEKILTGILYRAPSRPTFAERFRTRVTDTPLPELQPVDAGEIDRMLADYRPD